MRDDTSIVDPILAKVALALCGMHGLVFATFAATVKWTPSAAVALQAAYWPWLIWWPTYWFIEARAPMSLRIFAAAGTVAWVIALPPMALMAAAFVFGFKS